MKQIEEKKIDKHGPDKPEFSNKLANKVAQQTKVSTTVVSDNRCNNENINTVIPKLDKSNATATATDVVSPKHTKRKMIHSYFDHKSKRKFPGPAGLLTAGLQDDKDENICQLELLSQVTYSLDNDKTYL